MKILQVPANAGYGGMPLHVLTLAKGLAARGHEVEILCMSDGPMIPEYEDAGLKVTVVPSLGRRMRRDPLMALRVIRFLRDAIAGMEPDIIHTHGPRASFFTGLALRGNRRPLMVATAHGSFSQFTAGNEDEYGGMKRWIRNRQYRYFDSMMSRAADRVIAVCEATRNDLVGELGVPAGKVAVIRNGIEEHYSNDDVMLAIRREFDCGAGEKLVVFVGRIAFHKGMVFLVEAAKTVLAGAPRTCFVAVGEGPMEDELRRRTSVIPLAGRFTFTGRRNDAVDIIAASDLLVLPSLSEGLPLTLLEAAMTGTAMVASDVGGMPEVVIDGETGLLAPARDIGVLARAITRLLADDGEREKMGAAARRLWEKEFTTGMMVDKMEEEYRKAIAAIESPPV